MSSVTGGTLRLKRSPWRSAPLPQRAGLRNGTSAPESKEASSWEPLSPPQSPRAEDGSSTSNLPPRRPGPPPRLPPVPGGRQAVPPAAGSEFRAQAAGAQSGLSLGCCVSVVLFGWKQRPFWRDRGRSAQLEALLEPGGGEVFPAQGQPSISPRCPVCNQVVNKGGRTHGTDAGAEGLGSASPSLQPACLGEGLTIGHGASQPCGSARRVGLGPARTPAAPPYSSLWASRGPSGCGGLSGQEPGGGWCGRWAGVEPAGEDREALQFGLVFLGSALAREGSSPAWLRLRLRRGAVTEDAGSGGRVGTWQHARAGQGWGSAQALHTARSSGWASAALPGCLLKSDAAAK